MGQLKPFCRIFLISNYIVFTYVYILKECLVWSQSSLIKQLISPSCPLSYDVIFVLDSKPPSLQIGCWMVMNTYIIHLNIVPNWWIYRIWNSYFVFIAGWNEIGNRLGKHGTKTRISGITVFLSTLLFYSRFHRIIINIF